MHKKVKLYIVKKYVLASSAKEAIEKSKKAEVHEVWLEENAAKEHFTEIMKATKKNQIGFKSR